MRAAVSFSGSAARCLTTVARSQRLSGRPRQPTGGTAHSAGGGARRLQPRRGLVLAQAAGGESGDAPDDSAASDRPPRAISLPAGLPTAGAVFFIAGACKLLIMCFPFSEMAVMMYLRGRADLGVAAALKAIPLALIIAALAKTIVDRQWHKRRWVQVAVVLGGVLALYLSRLIFARPRPSPLDPMFQRISQERAAVAAQQRAANVQQRQHLLQQGDPEVGRSLLQQRQGGSRTG